MVPLNPFTIYLYVYYYFYGHPIHRPNHHWHKHTAHRTQHTAHIQLWNKPSFPVNTIEKPPYQYVYAYIALPQFARQKHKWENQIGKYC